MARNKEAMMEVGERGAVREQPAHNDRFREESSVYTESCDCNFDKDRIASKYLPTKVPFFLKLPKQKS